MLAVRHSLSHAPTGTRAGAGAGVLSARPVVWPPASGATPAPACSAARAAAGPIPCRSSTAAASTALSPLRAFLDGIRQVCEWAEIHTDDHVWTVPATRTKAKREHRVPLSGRVLEVSRRGAVARRRQPARVPERAGQADERHGPVGTAQDARGPGRAPRLPFHLRDWATKEPKPPARGRRGGAGPTLCRTRSRQPTPARTCSSGGGRCR